MRRIMMWTSLFFAINLVGCSTVQSLYKKNQAPELKPAGMLIAESVVLSPLAQVLKRDAIHLAEPHNISIQQVFNRVESPTAAQVTVIQSGLMDDSVSAIRTLYQFKQQDQRWSLSNTEKSYQCLRGKNKQSFQTQLCP